MRPAEDDVAGVAPCDAEAARLFGRVTAAVVAAGRKPRWRVADLMIAATAMAEDLPLFTTNPDDFAGLDGLVQVIPVSRPVVPHERNNTKPGRS
jgi:predicted nucleic acid-binding protein